MSEEAEHTVFVTAPRKLSDPAPAGASLGSAATIPFSSQSMPDVFEQTGGGETITTASFSLINGDLVVRLPGYDFPIKIPAASWRDMNASQKGAFIKLMAEFYQSPELVSFFNHLQSEGASVVEVYFDDDVHRPDGTTDPFETPDTPEEYRYSGSSSDPTNLTHGTKVVITINSQVVKDAREFVESLVHGLAHPFHGRDEWKIVSLDKIYNQIFNTPGERETRSEDYGAAAMEMLHVQFDGLIP